MVKRINLRRRGIRSARSARKNMPIIKRQPNSQSEYVFPLHKAVNYDTQESGISVIIPVSGLDRLPYLITVLRNLSAQDYKPLQIIISEYGIKGAQELNRPYETEVTYLYTKGGDLFNKSIAMNRAFMQAKHRLCVLLDADILLPSGYLHSVTKHIKKYDACFLLRRVLHVNHSKVKHCWVPPINAIRSDKFNGASLAIHQDAYYRIGGMCEEFEGYGYEDLEFWNRLRKLAKLNENRYYDVLHLDHPHPKGYDKQWKKNQDLWTKLSNIDPQERAVQFQTALRKYLS